MVVYYLSFHPRLFIQEGIKNGTFELIWSYILDIENDANPHPRRRKSIQAWRSFAKTDIEESEDLLLLMESFERRNIKPSDALHLAAAVVASADFFITVDGGILKKSIMELDFCKFSFDIVQ